MESKHRGLPIQEVQLKEQCGECGHPLRITVYYNVATNLRERELRCDTCRKSFLLPNDSLKS